jgi:disulfide bond formation protein DsbB
MLTPAESTPSRFSARLARQPAYRTGVLLFFAAAAVILTALAFEHIGGYKPCELCLQQRWAYYATIPALFVALVLVTMGQGKAAAGVFLLCGLAFLANAGLGAYHAGVEWEFWPGPDTCSAGALQPLPKSGADLLKQLSRPEVVPCTAAQLRIFGLSFAGWNVLASLALFAGSVKAVGDAWRG